MDLKKEFVIVIWVIALVGIFFLARGITGKVIMGSYTSLDECNSNIDCSNEKICCLSNNGIGMCTLPEACQQLSNQNERPQRDSNSFDIVLGLLILICVLLAVYSATRNKPKDIKKVSKKIVKKKKRK